MISNTPVSYGKLAGHYPFTQMPHKLRMPLNNLLLVSTKTGKKKTKKAESSRAVAIPIHQVISKETHDDDQSGNMRKYGRLRVSLMNERKKKKMSSFNSSFCSLYEKDVTKSKSEVLKKDFETAFKRMIGKKKLFSKQKQLKVTQQLWSSLKVRKNREGQEVFSGISLQGQKHVLPIKSNTSEKRLFNRTLNTLYSQACSATPQISKLYLTGHQFQRAKASFLKLREGGQLQDGHIKNCLHARLQGEIKPWNHENKRYKTEMGEGKSGEITEWLRGKKIS